MLSGIVGTGAVYTDILCRCVNTKSSPCINCCSCLTVTNSRMPVTAGDDDVSTMSRRAAAVAGADTAAAGPFFRLSTNPCRHGLQCLPTSVASGQMTTMIVTVASHDIIEMQRMDGADDVNP